MDREIIAKRVAKELQHGFIVNLGIGLPTLVANYVPQNIEVFFQSENGLLGIGPFPSKEQVDEDLINAGKQTITAITGASFFSSSDSFGMIRGGYIDLTVLGAMQVSQKGDIANWMIPRKMVKGMGGAMDLVYGAKKVIVAMEHQAKNGEHKILNSCSLPITGIECVDMIVTELAVFKFINKQIILTEITAGHTLEEIKEKTGCDFMIDKNLV